MVIVHTNGCSLEEEVGEKRPVPGDLNGIRMPLKDSMYGSCSVTSKYSARSSTKIKLTAVVTHQTIHLRGC
jgi:hypothetical protein